MKRLTYLLIGFLITFNACSNADNDAVIPEASADLLTPISTEQAETPRVLFADLNKIENGEPSTVIAQNLIDYIDAVPEGGSIHVSIYLFDYQPILQALRKAYLRKVELHVMVDASDRSNNATTVNEIHSWGEDIDIVKIHNDASASAINHNKFVLLSEVVSPEKTLQNVVFQTSHNFEEVSLRKIQDAVIFTDAPLYNAYLTYWEAIKKLSASGMKNYKFMQFTSPSGELSANFYPKRSNGERQGEDTFIELLNAITDPAQTTIQVGMSDWSDSRISILNKLEELLAEGATVEIITKTSNKGPKILKGLQAIKEKGAYVKIFNTSQINIHMKLMLISGSYKNATHNLIITGTQNFTNNAIWNNNETSLILKDHAFFPKYEDYYSRLKSLPGM